VPDSLGSFREEDIEMSRKSYPGAHTALITPFLPDGSMDWAGFEKNVNFHID